MPEAENATIRAKNMLVTGTRSWMGSGFPASIPCRAGRAYPLLFLPRDAQQVVVKQNSLDSCNENLPSVGILQICACSSLAQSGAGRCLALLISSYLPVIGLLFCCCP